MTARRRRFLVLALLATAGWLWFIFACSAQPADVSTRESDWALELVRIIQPRMSSIAIRKLAHFLEFFILGSMLWTDWRLLGRGTVFLPLSAGLLCAALDEFLQTFVSGRAGQLTDVLIDFSGVVLATLLLCLLLRCRRWRRASKQRRAVQSCAED